MRSDTELFNAYRNRGDRDAADELFRRHIDGVYRTARRILRHESDAEDAVQTAFSRALQHARTYREDSPFAGWLYRIAVNASLQIASARRARPSPSEAPAKEDAMRRELAESLEKAVDSLPDEYRLPILLHHYEGRSYEEIATALDCPRGTVGTRLHRGMERLRETLSSSGVVVTVAALLASMKEAEAAAAPPRLVEAVSRAIRSAPLPAAAGAAAAASVAGASSAFLVKAIVALAVLAAGVGIAVRMSRDTSPGAPIASSSNPANVAPPAAASEGAADASAASTAAGADSGEPTWAIVGRVLGPAGEPLAGAEIRINEGLALVQGLLGAGSEDPFIYPQDVRAATPPALPPGLRALSESSARTDAQGRYRYEVPVQQPESEGLSVRASHPAGASAAVTVTWAGTQGDIQAPDILLPVGGVLAGRVVDEDDRPIPGLPICLAKAGSGPLAAAFSLVLDRVPPVAQTDASGRFHIERVPAGKIQVGAAGGVYRPSSVTVELKDGMRRDDLVLRLKAGRVLEGVVQGPGGRPIPEATVTAHPSDPFPPWSASVLTNEAGRFRIEGAPKKRLTIVASAKGFRSQEREAALKESGIDFSLAVPGALAGRVLDRETGKPVASFTVSSSATPRDLTRGWPQLSAEGKDGAFRLEASDLHDGATDYYLTVRAKGYAPAFAGPFRFRDGETVDVGYVSLERGTALTGTVRDTRGQPVAGATVAVTTDADSPDPFPPADEEFLQIAAAFLPDRATTDGAGSFTIKNLAPGSYDVLVYHLEFPPHVQTGVAAAEGAALEIVLQEGGRLVGKLSSLPKQADLYVRAVETREDFLVPIAPDGSFRTAPLRPGSYRIRLVQPQGILSQKTLARGEVVVMAGAETPWSPEPSSQDRVEIKVRGTLRTPDGRPASGHFVALAGAEADGARGEFQMETTDSEGRFAISKLAPGRYRLICASSLEKAAQSAPYETITLEAHRPEVELDIRLKIQESSLFGMLVDAAGTPLGTYPVQLHPSGEHDLRLPVAQTITDARGLFRMEHLAAGTYELHLLDPLAGPGGTKLAAFALGEKQELDLGIVRRP